MEDLAARNRRVLRNTLFFAIFMVGVAFASVPLYRLICQVTGWGGTTMQTTVNAHQPIERQITVRFTSSVARGMPWRFSPDIREVKLNVGADGFVSYVAENTSQILVTGTAVYNVTPLKAGKYFYKTQCFCFGEQVLNPGEKVNMPVVFYVDPAIADDPEMRNVNTITLSYTFFKKDTEELENALQKYYNTETN